MRLGTGEHLLVEAVLGAVRLHVKDLLVGEVVYVDVDVGLDVVVDLALARDVHAHRRGLHLVVEVLEVLVVFVRDFELQT